MKITGQNLRKMIVKRLRENHCGSDRPFDAPAEENPGYMLLGNLRKLASKSAELADLATPWDNAEPWIESKINSAAEHMDAIHDYIMYSVLKQDFDAASYEDMVRECSSLGAARDFGSGGSSSMARGQLHGIARKAQSLHDRLQDEDTLPEWVQTMVSTAHSHIGMVSDYLDYEMSRADEEFIEAGLGDLELDGISEGLFDTVKGAFTGANKLAAAVFKVIDDNFPLKNAMYKDYLTKRSKPESAIKTHMVTFRKKFDEIFGKVGVRSEQRPEVERILLPKLVELMGAMDDARAGLA